MLSKKHLQDVCLCDQGSSECRYLKRDELNWDHFHCVKLRPNEKASVDAKLESVITEAIKNRIDPNSLDHPLGDYCQGYPMLKTIEQGYDKD